MIRRALVLPVAAMGLAAMSPSELPPEGYSGAEFVDSSGCVFTQVLLDGAVIWAPRVTAEGAQVCDAQPSVSAGRSDSLPAIAPQRRNAAPEFPRPGSYVQVGAFGRVRTADQATADLQHLGFEVLRQDFNQRGGVLRVLFAGPFPDQTLAQDARQKIRLLGFRDAFIWAGQD